MSYFEVIIAVLATVILFLYGLQSFSREIQVLGKDRLHNTLERMTRNRFLGFILGALFTALVQSSSAVSALAVALVDAGAISFANSIAVLIGTNVGTTATAWLVSMKLTWIGPVFIVLGALVTTLPGTYRVMGKSLFYFGFIFFALELVSGSLAPMQQDERVVEMLKYASTPLIGALIGLVLTALLQSSSVVTGLSILLVQQGVIDIQAAVAIIIGANAGTTVTGLIASIPMNNAARSTAKANLYMNTVGVLLFIPLIGPLSELVDQMADDPGISVAIAHMIFNVSVAILALPMVGPIARWLAPKENRG